MQIQIPNNWQPREYQKPAWNALCSGFKRACIVAHRRWGKDDLALHWAAVSAMEKPATYWHMLPEAAQARKAIWEAVNPHTGKRRIDEAFPQAIRKSTRENEMMIKFVNGSSWQVVGSDNYNSLVGSPPYGLTFSEWSLCDPNAWAYLRPILAENGGWAIFIYTSRGKNHGYSLYNMATESKDWYSLKSSAKDTDVFNDYQLEQELKEYEAAYGVDAGKAYWLQEYFCSFDAALPGAYYVGELSRAEQDGRITSLPYESTLPVHTWWDIGRTDYTAIWFCQYVGREVRFIDYYQNNMREPKHYAEVLRDRGYFYEEHHLPHDADFHKFEAKDGKSAKEQFQELMPREDFTVHNRVHSVESSIYQAKAFFSRCVFDKNKTKDGLESLGSFAQAWDDKHKVFTGLPSKGWFRHGADAFMYAAVGYTEESKDYQIDDSNTFMGAMRRNKPTGGGRNII
jgi:hypothetical protein